MLLLVLFLQIYVPLPLRVPASPPDTPPCPPLPQQMAATPMTNDRAIIISRSAASGHRVQMSLTLYHRSMHTEQ